MSKVFVIPDIHLKPWILDEVDKQLANGNYDTIICLGDLVDDWDQQDNIELYENTFDALTDFIRRHPNFLYCYGNHDISYEWEALETGYSDAARSAVLDGLARLRDTLPPENIAFIHRIDNVLFSHAGLAELFVKNFFTDSDKKFNDILAEINGFGKKEMWCDVSPIWARPQSGYVKPYPEGFMQVVGHTPVRKTGYFDGFLSVDNFSTYQNGDPIGDQRFVWVDTELQQWGFTDKGDEPERLADLKLDIRNYHKGDWVLFQIKMYGSDEIEYHEGTVEIIDKYPDGYASIDVQCKDVLYKHVSLKNVIQLLKAGISGDTCVVPPRWDYVPGKIAERTD